MIDVSTGISTSTAGSGTAASANSERGTATGALDANLRAGVILALPERARGGDVRSLVWASPLPTDNFGFWDLAACLTFLTLDFGRWTLACFFAEITRPGRGCATAAFTVFRERVFLVFVRKLASLAGPGVVLLDETLRRSRRPCNREFHLNSAPTLLDVR